MELTQNNLQAPGGALGGSAGAAYEEKKGKY